MYINRTLELKINKYLNKKEIIAVIGPRQCGKTTLLKHIFDKLDHALFISFEDREILEQFSDDIKLFAEKYVKKGSKLFLEGKIATRQYEKDGQTKYFTEIVVNNMVMLDSKNAASPAENKDNSNQEPKAASTVNEPDTEDLGGDEDLPF